MTSHVVTSSSHHQEGRGGSSSNSSSSNVIGVHFRVGRKIGEGSFGVIFEGEDSLPLLLLDWYLENSMKLMCDEELVLWCFR